MKANLSIYESILRLFIGILWAGIFGGWLMSWVGILAIYPFVTSMSGWCPIYALRHWYTNETNPYLEGHGKSPSTTLDQDTQTTQTDKVRLSA